MPYLVRKKLDGSIVESWEIGNQPLVFGRGEQADCQIHDERMSRRHFVITAQDDGRYRIQDLGSTNGTYLNHVRITESVLKPDDKIRAGQTVLIFVTAKPAGPHSDDSRPNQSPAATTRSS
jgi:pSer/pThr/pTyr-binding forkhead associated (FHA) protein